MRGKTPNEFIRNKNFEASVLLKKFGLPNKPIPIMNGGIHLIRFIRSDRILNIFGEHFQMPKDVVYEYVVATILTDIHSLKVSWDGKIVNIFDYQLPIVLERKSC